KLKSLYQAAPPDAVRLHEEMDAPWTAPAAKEEMVLRVARAPEKAGDRTYPTLAAAAAAAPKDAVTAIEVHDNGPLFEAGFRVSHRKLIVRAGPGYRPLLVWDTARAPEERARSATAARPEAPPPAFLEVSNGDLTVEGCEVVTRWPEDPGPNRAAVFRVRDGELTVRACSVSLTGGPEEGAAAAQLVSARPAGGPLRLERCYLRGGRRRAPAPAP